MGPLDRGAEEARRGGAAVFAMPRRRTAPRAVPVGEGGVAGGGEGRAEVIIFFVLFFFFSPSRSREVSKPKKKTGLTFPNFPSLLFFFRNRMAPECAVVKMMLCLKYPDLSIGVPLAGEL